MNTTTQYYRVGEHVFAIQATREQFGLIPNYAPFLIAPNAGETAPTYVFIIRVSDRPMPSCEGWEHVYTDRSDDDMPRIEMYSRQGEWLFRVSVSRDSEVVSAMRCSADWKEVELFFLPQYTRFAIDNAAMLVYAFATTAKGTLLFHSSVTMRDGKGYMFLGHSGTGKSTHSRQWLTAFPDAELLNDDNPVLRILPDKSVRVYGSPWSGKTPCYKAADVPVGALVQLAQVPVNEIKRLKMTQAYPYILASVSGLKLQPEMMDRLYESIAELLELCPVYKLDCLPNPEAARLCAQTCLS